MPIARFQMPDGRVARFEVPEGTTPEQAQGMMAEHFAQDSKTSQPEKTQRQSESGFKNLQGSKLGGIVQGARDPINELAVLLPKGLESVTSLGGYAENPVSLFFGSEASRVQDINKANELAYQQAREASGREGMDVSRFVGNVVSPVNLAAALRAGPALTAGSKALQGAKFGALGGAVAGGEDVNSPDYWRNKAETAGLGAALGAAVPTVIGGVSRMVNPQVNPKVAELMRQGITPTPGQILGGIAQTTEEKLQSVPIIGEAIGSAKGKALKEFNMATLNRALAPINEQATAIGREGVAQVKAKISQAYDDLLPKINFVPDQQFAQEFSNVQNMAAGLGSKEQSKFSSIINDVMSKASPNGSMTGETFKIAESKLSNEAKKFAGSTDAYQRELGDALNETLRIMRDTLPRVNPQYGKELGAVNEAFANYARIRTAASSTATGAREGIFTPAQLASAVRQADKSAGKGASATGRALLQDLAEQGSNVLGSKTPDSGTAGRAMLGAGLGGGAVYTGTAIPMAAGLGISSLPYLGAGRTLAANVLTKRPQQAESLANLLRRSAPALSGAIPFVSLNQK